MNLQECIMLRVVGQKKNCIYISHLAALNWRLNQQSEHFVKIVGKVLNIKLLFKIAYKQNKIF